ncbi:MAG: hypothetical protein V2I67_07360 [Thermoanaerobaculales bacterium]|nr:hypothetical protein [Thermoanaerobaculales bacterium]
MESPHCFDIAFLGLKDPSAGGRSRMINAMERLTGRSTADCQESLSRIGMTIFENLPVEQARLILKAMDDAGAICEVRPKDELANAADSDALGGMQQCPSCGFVQSADSEECPRCGVIFSKMEKDEVRKMQKDSALEEAQARAEQIKQEWDDRAKQLIENNPLPDGAVDAFDLALTQEEIPFLLLEAAEGTALMTSRQILVHVDGEFVYLPYEIIKDVDYGGGLVVKKGHTRLVLNFHAPVPFRGKSANSITLQLTADSATNKEAIMDWAFARSYMCGSCGARDFDYHQEKAGLHARCMHCATDHAIDLKNHAIKPLIKT